MDEILYELERIRWIELRALGYLFSCIKKLHQDSAYMLAERGMLSMTTPFMRAYSLC